ncbi:heavy metal-binding domain-containing protein [Sphingobacterium sp. PCS056]|uniref:heavy metal-binding domain-containing protein n=1 Tax=Sphingobacterium sp. PCS056 TaxID=2931400 RepID=UPI0020107819|nr:heavy metal-binding domain-containing protein [Sphingobacterium sp. PCS056]UPZ35252.1 heavy metal-binding domain-containing protein [Sphingobacterium sp. PCS056]
MIVTSTHTIEGREVLRYFDPISATAVIGANALSAIRSGFRRPLRWALPQYAFSVEEE